MPSFRFVCSWRPHGESSLNKIFVEQELGPDTVAGFAMETTVGATSGVGMCQRVLLTVHSKLNQLSCLAVTPPKGYIRAMKEVCDKYGAL